ncbi:hypothetical protein TeGR_g267, partial [Tetraparma gracilis]
MTSKTPAPSSLEGKQQPPQRPALSAAGGRAAGLEASAAAQFPPLPAGHPDEDLRGEARALTGRVGGRNGGLEELEGELGRALELVRRVIAE